jgi:predicted RNase H-like HicB family nuclease
MPAACSIIVEQLEDGRYRATCSVFPELEALAATEEAARQGLEEAIAKHLRQQLGEEEPNPPVTECL